MTADDVIAALNLAPHPEGGHYRETWVADGPDRPSGTAIYFLLKAGEKSRWHKVDATEIWHYYAGAPLILRIAETRDGPAHVAQLGPNLLEERPQRIVPPGHWQSAETTGDWTLVGCTDSPGFRFEGFELAPPGFDIPDA
ncbi:MAG: cupin domain-containing protein [Pseudomonadota bacterium]